MGLAKEDPDWLERVCCKAGKSASSEKQSQQHAAVRSSRLCSIPFVLHHQNQLPASWAWAYLDLLLERPGPQQEMHG